ncbi:MULTISPECIES: tyrosine-type recombinase/integrase [Acinetobacter]|jgi:integrase|uniref:Integrase n=2 Tax=Gammaproteobacteria TaxID=1236 RepID=A0AB73FB87_ACIBA|nr:MULTISPECIES: integrase domain-containing protein [Acinetobacter calcoaceticus/baumannii complex]KQD13281.1 integrase [Acinetobacter baumannii]MDA3321116.1 integrase domain-containing protein [Acinetobacter baumannii]MDA3436911.1 integrase domain-containing protein [Acinetobacter baumannii]MDU7564068.1 integrase domain-containing protein [Acinetobacter baumannii]MDX8161143.1 integrase domain-containing protein [Acinetobacter pittii]
MTLKNELDELCKKFRTGSHATQANRRAMLHLFSDQLASIGFNTYTMRATDIKGKHINRLIEFWRREGLSAGTIKNRMSVLRFWAEKVGNPGAIKDNNTYKLEKRVYVTNENKSVSLKELDLSQIDQNIAQSLRLQDAFGLRREESMKFQPVFALDGQKIDSAKYIRIKGSWAKGGRPRTIPITNEKQRNELRNAYARAVENGGSLIPKEKSYVSHMSFFEKVTSALGVGQTHGLRHGYAQDRYFELMGFQCPAVGGVRELTAEEKEKDAVIRLQISEELGHSRINITSVYLGSWSKK